MCWCVVVEACDEDVGELVVGFFFFKQKTAYEIQYGLVGSEMCIRDSNASVLSSMADETPEGKSIIELADINPTTYNLENLSLIHI